MEFFKIMNYKFNNIQSILKKNLKYKTANVDLLSNAITKGFKPKWYCVFHFNDGGLSNRQRYRRTQNQDVVEDLCHVRDVLYRKVYGKNWQKVTSRAKGLWGIEYGKNPDKPHVNLIIESLPDPYESQFMTYDLIDRFLPYEAKCLSDLPNHSHVQEIYEPNGLLNYISKESDFRNASLVYKLNDY